MAATIPLPAKSALGEVEVEFMAEDVGFAVPLGAITLTECQMVNQFKGSATEAPCFTRGYGLAFGQSRAQDHVDGAGRPQRCAPANSVRRCWRRPRTRSS